MTRYSQAFKDQAVKLSDDFGLKKAAEQLGIFSKHACVLSRLRVVTLACWRQKKKRMPEGKSFVICRHERQRQKKIDELKEENEILKEAMRFFVVERR